MADYTLDTRESALKEADVIGNSIADSTAVPPLVGVLRLCDAPFVPTADSVQADFVAAETALGGYPAGGYTMANMAPPLAVDGGGAVTTTPLIHIAYTVAPGAAISAWWIEDDAGVLRKAGVFDPPRSLQAIGDGFEFVRQFLYGRNSLPVVV